MTYFNISVMQVLASHRILSAPVVSGKKGASSGANNKALEESSCSEGGSTPGSRLIRDRLQGFIDIRDILSSFLLEVDLKELQNAKMLKRMRVLEEKGQEFACKAIQELKSLGSDGWFYDLEETKHASILEIIMDGFLNLGNKPADAFGGTRRRRVVHRLALCNNDGSLTNVVSQSDVAKFLFDNLSEFGKLGDETAEELGFVRGPEHVVKVAPECPALDAMILMEERDISAVAVVNSVGSIIGNFSISELRNIMSEHFGSLALPVGEFLALEHGTEYAGYAITRDGSSPGSGIGNTSPMKSNDVPMGTSPGSRPSGAGFKFAQDREMRRRDSAPGHEVGQNLITCSPNSPLSDILSTIVHNRLHRVYICSDDMVPCGVITLTDLLRKMAMSS
jgi:5'-AMP-activated protein kinase regulatory gamma subunit